jgi:hypothetical protein
MKPVVLARKILQTVTFLLIRQQKTWLVGTACPSKDAKQPIVIGILLLTNWKSVTYFKIASQYFPQKLRKIEIISEFPKYKETVPDTLLRHSVIAKLHFRCLMK